MKITLTQDKVITAIFDAWWDREITPNQTEEPIAEEDLKRLRRWLGRAFLFGGHAGSVLALSAGYGVPEEDIVEVLKKGLVPPETMTVLINRFASSVYGESGEEPT